MFINKKIELLAPAGNFEKLETAVYFGADAVYIGGKNFSLRSYSDNFTINEMNKAVNFAHKNKVKVYITCNIYSRNSQQEKIIDFLKKFNNINIDAIIISDPGIFLLAKEIIPDVDIHISTQANTTNYNNVKFWERLGAKRVNLARELSLHEIEEITSRNSIEIETFVHGAMCISHSGRCLLSNFMVKRDANLGLCSHPCRWSYYLVEQKRPGEYLPIFENNQGTHIFNSKDLCMIGYIPELILANISSLKIEGRIKGINYLASVIKTYREAIDLYYSNPELYQVREYWFEELSRINNRHYCTGFYFNDPSEIIPNYNDKRPSTIHRFIGKITHNIRPSFMEIEVRNKFLKGDDVEILSPKGLIKKDKILKIIKKNNTLIEFAQPNTNVCIQLNDDYSPNDLIRKLEEISYLSEKINL